MSNYCVNCETTAIRVERAEAEVDRLRARNADLENACMVHHDEVQRLLAALEEWKRTDNAPGCTACSVLARTLNGEEA